MVKPVTDMKEVESDQEK